MIFVLKAHATVIMAAKNVDEQRVERENIMAAEPQSHVRGASIVPMIGHWV